MYVKAAPASSLIVSSFLSLFLATACGGDSGGKGRRSAGDTRKGDSAGGDVAGGDSVAGDSHSGDASVATYNVGGTITGYSSSGLVLALVQPAETLPISAAGPFQFSAAVADGAPYLVEVETQPSGQWCEIAGGAGRVGGADVSDVAVTCNSRPTVDAGTYDYLPSGAALDASGSADADSATLTYGWREVTSYGVTFANNGGTDPSATTVSYDFANHAGVAVIAVIVELSVSDGFGPPVTQTAGLLMYREDFAYAAVGATGTGAAPDDAAGSVTAALAFAKTDERSAVVVAAGLYETCDSIVMENGISLYGGYAASDWQRNPAVNETRLQCLLYTDPGPPISVVRFGPTVAYGPSTVLDGFTVISNWDYAVYVRSGSPTIAHNHIWVSGDNGSGPVYGVRVAESGSPIITGNRFTADFINQPVIVASNSTTVSIINNSFRTDGGAVLVNQAPGSTVAIRNNSIFGTGSADLIGIEVRGRVGSTPAAVYVDNNIIWLNGSGGNDVCIAEVSTLADTEPAIDTIRNNDLFGCDVTYIDVDEACDGNSTPDAEDAYCTIAQLEGLGDIDASGNVSVNPGFVGAWAQDYLLSASSPANVVQGGLDGAAQGWGFSADKAGKARTNFAQEGEHLGPTNANAAGWSMGAYEGAVPDASLPIAEAGVYGFVANGDTLDASGSFDPEGDPLTYTWQEVSSHGVVLHNGIDTNLPRGTWITYEFPEGEVAIDVVLQLTAHDGVSDPGIDQATLTLYNPEFLFVTPTGTGQGTRPDDPSGDLLGAVARAQTDKMKGVAVAQGTYSFDLRGGEKVELGSRVGLFGGYLADTWARNVNAYPTVVDDGASGSGTLSAPTGLVHLEKDAVGTLDGVTIRISAGGSSQISAIFVGEYSDITMRRSVVEVAAATDAYALTIVNGGARIAGNRFDSQAGSITIQTYAAVLFYNNVVRATAVPLMLHSTGARLVTNNTFVAHGPDVAYIIGLDGTQDLVLDNNIFDMQGATTSAFKVAVREMTSLSELASLRNNAFADAGYLYYDADQGCDDDTWCVALMWLEQLTDVDASGNVVGLPVYVDASGGDFRLDPSTPVDIRRGGLDGEAQDWFYGEDLTGETRTNDSTGAANDNAAGWSMGAYEAD